MEVVYPDGVSIGIYQTGFFEAGLTAIFLQRVKPGMTVFDVAPLPDISRCCHRISSVLPGTYTPSNPRPIPLRC